MNCIKPVFGHPCGKCLNCRIQYSSSWASRLMHELSSWNNNAVFLTLTYNDFFVPDQLYKKPLQLFFKRLRKRLKTPIKYFACGEYGSAQKTSRPHFHAIIFGVDWTYNALFHDLWPFGFIKVGSVTYDSCRYVTDYVLKKYSGEKAKAEYGDKQVPFRLMSNGLGKSFFLSNLDNMLSNHGFFVRGKKRSLPRYYRDLAYTYFLETESLIKAIEVKNELRKYSLDSSDSNCRSLVDRFNNSVLSTHIDLKDHMNNIITNKEKHNEYKLNNFAKGGI